MWVQPYEVCIHVIMVGHTRVNQALSLGLGDNYPKERKGWKME